MDESEALRLAAECAYFSPFEQIMQYMGNCEIHEVIFVEVDPTKPQGCPICSGRITIEQVKKNSEKLEKEKDA
jgi:rRNA maturation endonuclease Nob1